MGIGQRIKELRERAGMTQEELAERLSVTPSAVGNYERGISHPKEEVLLRLFSALGCEPNELFVDFFNPDEAQRHMIMYRSLDSHGKELVDACTELEYRRICACANRAKSDAEDCTVLVAARDGGIAKPMRMKTRKGLGSILDAPDCKGVR